MLTNVHFPLLPLQFVAIHLETYAFRLNDMQRLQIVPKLEIFIILDDEIREEVKLLRRRIDTPAI